tara:strand:- start:177 stop:419 length:243 start_codon:yes stop_codon:yes gene_type:complete
MVESSIWLSEKQASKVLRVDEQYLELLREKGYLKPGLHWRSSNEPKQLPWKPKVFYFIRGCEEVIEYCKNNDAAFDQIAA